MKKFILPLAIIAVLFAMAISVSPAMAQGLEGALESLGTLQSESGLPEGDLYQTVGGIINIILGLIGLILVVLIIYAGFLWMTAQGDSKKVDQAKDIIKNAIIGILVTLLAYGIAQFVLTALTESLGG
jgi:uncharacterized membrane protein